MARQLFRAVRHPRGWLADYEIRGNQIFRTGTHPDGRADWPDYEIRSDGKVYRTMSHKDGQGNLPDFEVL